MPPLSWWLREPVSRASFLLTIAYLTRDRETKLRVYPGIAPILFLPFILLFQGNQGKGPGAQNFMIPFMGVYLGMIPMYSLQLLRFSQQWQAADVFQMTPIPGPGRVSDGARQAVLFLLATPIIIIVVGLAWLLSGFGTLLLILPGLTVLPVFSIFPSYLGKGMPLCQPLDSAKAAGRAPIMYLITAIAFALAFLTSFAWSRGWFWEYELILVSVSAALYGGMRWSVARQGWPSAE
jgi:hypothetical protein